MKNFKTNSDLQVEVRTWHLQNFWLPPLDFFNFRLLKKIIKNIFNQSYRIINFFFQILKAKISKFIRKFNSKKKYIQNNLRR